MVKFCLEGANESLFSADVCVLPRVGDVVSYSIHHDEPTSLPQEPWATEHWRSLCDMNDKHLEVVRVMHWFRSFSPERGPTHLVYAIVKPSQGTPK